MAITAGLKPYQDFPAQDFTILFDPDFSPAEVRLILDALANYYRQCGGVGLPVEFRLEEAEVLEPEYA